MVDLLKNLILTKFANYAKLDNFIKLEPKVYKNLQQIYMKTKSLIFLLLFEYIFYYIR